jgi:uncharacterized membrane protein
MKRFVSLGLSLLTVAVLLFVARRVYYSLPESNLEGQDIYYSYVEGKRLTEGKNPYARILDGNMRENQKYATYFPVFYELSYLSQKMGLRSLEKWMGFWKPIFLAFGLGIGFLIYAALAQRNMEWLGVFGAGFWLFGRWTLKIVEMQTFDFIPIFFSLLAVIIFPRKKWLALFLFSLALGFKQIGIFLAPLFLVWIWQQAEKNRIRQTLLAGIVIASVPLLSSLPFLVWNWEGFVKSVLFSATRLASNQFGVPSIDALFGLEGLTARIFMLGLLAAIYLLAFTKPKNRFLITFIVMAVFIDYNSVLYSQYPAWAAPIIPLLFLDGKDHLQADERNHPAPDAH